MEIWSGHWPSCLLSKCWNKSVCLKAEHPHPPCTVLKTHQASPAHSKPSGHLGDGCHCSLILSCHTHHACLVPCCHQPYPAAQSSLPRQSSTLHPLSFLHPECSSWMNLPRHTLVTLEKIGPHSNSQAFDGSSISCRESSKWSQPLSPAVFRLSPPPSR